MYITVYKNFPILHTIILIKRIHIPKTTGGGGFKKLTGVVGFKKLPGAVGYKKIPGVVGFYDKLPGWRVSRNYRGWGFL